MKLLAIDTSTERATVAIVSDGNIHCEEQHCMRQHAQFLLPMVERLLALSEITLAQLDGIIFGRGPGSFTGLRIACSVAKGLAYAHDLPLYPVSDLAAIAYQKWIEKKTAVLALIDARMHQLYWGYFTGDSFAVLEHVTAAADIFLPNPAPFIIAGVGYEPYLTQLPDILQRQIIQQHVVFPNANTLIYLVQSGQIQPVSVDEALPVYIRDQVTQGEATRG